MKIILILKFWLYGCIGTYDVFHNNKWCCLWFMLSAMCLAFFIEAAIQELKDKIKP